LQAVGFAAEPLDPVAVDSFLKRLAARAKAGLERLAGWKKEVKYFERKE